MSCRVEADRRVVVCGSYPGAVPWTTNTLGESHAALAQRLAGSAGCRYYTVAGIVYGPFGEEIEVTS